MNWYLLGLSVYLLTLIGVSIYAARKVKDDEDFAVAGRSLPFWLLAFTFAGLWFGGGTVIGTTGVAFENGIWSTTDNWGVIPDPYGAGLCLILAGLFYFGVLRKTGGVTLADYFERRFGRSAATLSTVIMVFGWTFFVAAQVVVFGKIFNAVLGWSFVRSIWLGMVLVVIYTIAGGLWSVALTDMVQMIIILLGILLAVPVGLHAIGGFGEVREALGMDMTSFFPRGDGPAVQRWVPWFTGWIIIGFGSIASPDITQVAQSGIDDRQVRRASVLAGLMYWVFGSLLVLLGLIGAALVTRGQIPVEALNGDPELIMPIMITHLFPLPLAILFVAAVLAAVMSSADGALLALSTLFTRNILPLFRKREESALDGKRELRYARLAVVAFAIITTVIGVSFPYAFLLMNFGFDALLAGLFVPLTLAIYWKKANTPGFLAGVTTGIGVRVILSGLLEGWTLESITYPERWYIYTLAAPLANMVIMVLVSYLTADVTEEQAA